MNFQEIIQGSLAKWLPFESRVRAATSACAGLLVVDLCSLYYIYNIHFSDIPRVFCQEHAHLHAFCSINHVQSLLVIEKIATDYIHGLWCKTIRNVPQSHPADSVPATSKVSQANIGLQAYTRLPAPSTIVAETYRKEIFLSTKMGKLPNHTPKVWIAKIRVRQPLFARIIIKTLYTLIINILFG